MKWNKLKTRTKAGMIALVVILSITIVAFAASFLINKNFKTKLTKGQILSMQLVQTDLEGTVVPGDTIDVCPAIYNDGDRQGLAFMRVTVPTLSDGSFAYSWTVGEGWTKVAEGTGFVAYGYSPALDGESSTAELMSGMTMVEMSGAEFKGLSDVNVTVDGWLADTEEYGTDADSTVWTRIVNGQ